MGAPRIDLNLLLVFEAVLETRSTTLAAASLGLTQSAVSNALSRLRGALGDPLFVRTSSGMTPTPRAEEIAAPLRASIEQIRQTLGQHVAFDAATSNRRFRIYMTDVGQMVLMPPLLETLQRVAPGVSIDIVGTTSPSARELAMSSGDVDLAVGYFEDFQGPYHVQGLFKQHYVCVVRDSPSVSALGETLTLEQYARFPHAVYLPRGGGHLVQERAIEAALSQSGTRRRVLLRASHFLGFSRIVASTDLMSTLPTQLAQACAAVVQIRTFPVPFEIPAVEVCQYWHRRFHQDPSNIWLRRLIARTFGTSAASDAVQPEHELPIEDASWISADDDGDSAGA